jgi:hypothetical protein
MDPPNGAALKFSAHSADSLRTPGMFWDGGAKKTGVCARWDRKGASEDSNRFISAGATAGPGTMPP